MKRTCPERCVIAVRCGWSQATEIQPWRKLHLRDVLDDRAPSSGMTPDRVGSLRFTRVHARPHGARLVKGLTVTITIAQNSRINISN